MTRMTYKRNKKNVWDRITDCNNQAPKKTPMVGISTKNLGCLQRTHWNSYHGFKDRREISKDLGYFKKIKKVWRPKIKSVSLETESSTSQHKVRRPILQDRSTTTNSPTVTRDKGKVAVSLEVDNNSKEDFVEGDGIGLTSGGGRVGSSSGGVFPKKEYLGTKALLISRLLSLRIERLSL
ncbi:hypothetical protein AMTR_s00053p00198980 [Amborella trichopoda]|uniref:Uncharacterized protein n=1 Tax=Amborella trichopoda TaxID=13333 RepID=W1PB42_AMBTC|nr:hypothetical protein AMTR_s00053p00198980 [Amborella trichopoda]